MNTPDPPIHQTLRTLSRIATITGTAFLIISLTLNFIPAKTVSATSGSIWTTRSTCIPPAPQDENHYTWGEEVYIRGSNFDPNTDYYWGITGQPGGASADPGIIVAAWYIAPGTVITTDADGYFCFKAYTIAPDDLGEYNVDVFEVGGTHAKSDNYQVDPAPTATLTDTPTNTPTETPTDTRPILRPTHRPTPQRHANQYPHQHADHYSDGYPDQHADQYTDGYPNCDANPYRGPGDGRPNHYSNQHADQYSNGDPNSNPDQYTHQHADQYRDEHPNDHTGQH